MHRRQVLFFLFLFILADHYSTILYSQSIQWERTNGPYGLRITSIAFDTVDFIYATAYNEKNIYRSSNKGESWERISIGREIGKLVVHNSGTLYASAGSIVTYSTDRGYTWIDSKPTLNNKTIRLLWINPVNDDIYIVTEFPCSIQKSADHGITWTQIIVKDPDDNIDQNIFSFTEDNSGNLFVGTFKHGVLKSSDHGKSWLYASSGIPFSYVVGLENISVGNDNYIIAATHNDGVFR